MSERAREHRSSRQVEFVGVHRTPWGVIRQGIPRKGLASLLDGHFRDPGPAGTGWGTENMASWSLEYGAGNGFPHSSHANQTTSPQPRPTHRLRQTTEVHRRTLKQPLESPVWVGERGDNAATKGRKSRIDERGLVAEHDRVGVRPTRHCAGRRKRDRSHGLYGRRPPTRRCHSGRIEGG